MHSALYLAIMDLRDGCHCWELWLTAMDPVSNTSTLRICVGTYSAICVPTCLFALADVVTFITAIPKLPAKALLHPVGAGADGEIFSVTACLSTRNGEALAIAARARIARDCIVVGVDISIIS